MPHTALTYLMGPDGSYVTHFPDTIDPDAFARRIAELVTAS
jgi:protein SCO1/2